MKEQDKYRQTVEIITQPSQSLTSTKEQCNSMEYNCFRTSKDIKYKPTTSIRTFKPRKFNIDPSVECVIDLKHKPFVLRGCVIDQLIDPSVEHSVPTFTPTIVPTKESNTSTIPSINGMSLRIISRQSIQVGNKYQSNVVPDSTQTFTLRRNAVRRQAQTFCIKGVCHRIHICPTTIVIQSFCIKGVCYWTIYYRNYMFILYEYILVIYHILRCRKTH